MHNAWSTAGEIETASAGGWSITLNIAALLNAVIWPIVLLVICLTYRQHIPALLRHAASGITKLGLGNFSIDFAVARVFVPAWSEAAGALDLRHRAQAGQVQDIFMMTFRSQMLEQGTWD